MKPIPKTYPKILLIVTAVMFLSVGLSATALNAATFDASMNSKLTLTGITIPGVTGPSPLSVSNVNFLGTLELLNNTITGPASINGTFVSYTINGIEVSTDIPGDQVSFNSSAGFGIGDYFSLNSEAFSTINTTVVTDATAVGTGTLDFTSTSNFVYQLYFNLIWSMSATTTLGIGEGVNSVAETFIFADIVGGETTDGQTILASTLGRSVNGVGDYSDITVSTDFSLLLAPGETKSIEIQFNEANGYIDSGAQSPPSPINPVPVPATLWLLGGGLVCLVGLRRRTTHNS